MNQPANSYLEYLTANCPDINVDFLAQLVSNLENTEWDEPISAIDLNNVAVVALIEAEQCQDLSLRKFYLEMAVEALNKGITVYQHPLCSAHLALVLAMTGEMDTARDMAYSTFINTVQTTYIRLEKPSPGIIYFYQGSRSLLENKQEQLIQSLTTEDSDTQALLLSTQVLCQTEIAFYSEENRRSLYLAAQLFSNSIKLNLQLGISCFLRKEYEGIFYFHQARELAPDSARILQALYLAYRDLGQTEVANFWLEVSRIRSQEEPDSLDLQWTQLALNSPISYLPFNNDILLAVEPSFRSIVTSVLLAEGDWFEKEMEFWRNWIKPGMTVIDVGANVGVYTFSAAQQVGSQGRVIAVEPFSKSVRSLQETCRINNFNWVKICAGAASDRNGTAMLSLYTASEINRIVTDDIAKNMKPESFEEVTCFTLDTLIQQENLSQVDIIKIDAEGHELSVLTGSERILSEFAPIILYENLAGERSSNLTVVDYLIEKGYELFRYKPYLQELIPIDVTQENWHNSLNIIAVPKI